MQENPTKRYIQTTVVSWELFCTYYLIEFGGKYILLETKIFGFCDTRWFYVYDTQVVSLQIIRKKKNALKCLTSFS